MTKSRLTRSETQDNGEKIGLERATARLRRHVLAKEPGSFAGTEDELVEMLEASRGTLRQAARLLEREGLVAVRRGVNGGYYSARPSMEDIETAVSGYLHTLDVTADDATMIASVLWIQTLLKLAATAGKSKSDLMDQFMSRLTMMNPQPSLEEIIDYEIDLRNAIFNLLSSKYVQMIFKINMKFSFGNFDQKREQGAGEHAQFVRAWRDAKYLELAAVANGDISVTKEAATRARRLWHERFGVSDGMMWLNV